MAITRWHELYESRLDWAERAYANFLHEIDKEVARDFERKGEVTVVLYGRTQVGKTTLLLKVLGIDDGQFARVSQLLRGGRDAGHSATATATRYARSPDDRWRIGPDLDQADPLTDEEIEQKLAELRQRVEAGQYDDDTPVNIWIPRRYFSDQAPSIDVRILDLPGTHSSNANEQRHVARIAARFVPTADVVLLVGKANALGFLKPEELGLEELQYWLHSPDRFKLILTHTYSAQSIKEWIGERGACDLEAIRRYMLDQLRTHEYEIDDRISSSIYPIEFGGSWEALRHRNDPVFSFADPLVGQLLDGLSRDVLEAATKYARIRSAFNVHTAIKEKSALDLRKLNGRKNAAESALNDAQIRLSNIDEEIAGTLFLISDIRAKLEIIIYSITDDVILTKEVVAVGKADVSRSAKDVSVLKDFIAEVQGELASQWERLRDEASLEGAGEVLGDFPSALAGDCFRGIIGTLNDYSWDYYLWLDNYLGDRRSALDSHHAAAIKLRVHAATILTEHYRDFRDRLLSRDTKTREILENLFYYKREISNDVQMLRDKVGEANRAIADFVEASQDREERARNFDKHLRSAFAAEIEAQQAAIASANDPAEKFSILCHAVLLGDEYRRLEI